ncbi:glycosyltransferase family 90 protein [Pleomassaria siparia CBS 279.74]|uniref:Glycosyltransferase family 90 protein n=1 Tax=Pleomassaria siparia CBS 279.74 TaxID=1314801 RepID=A0A6G1KN98_9PLEO|nr:glycosyltransferase family 90 protein [Pleomassaria siparia CBS 279.74]
MRKRPQLLSPRTSIRALGCFALFFVLAGTLWLWDAKPQRRMGMKTGTGTAPIAAPPSATYEEPHPVAHPIDYLMKKAYGTHRVLLGKQTTDLSSTAKAYRKRRGRHPPPGFDKWFQYAKKHNAIIVEDFFDQIYHDLNPFWGVEAKGIREQSKHFPHVISVRNGKLTVKTDIERDWMKLWKDLVQKIKGFLPDVDIPVNMMDESRVIVPWSDIDRYVQAERKSRGTPPVKAVVKKLTGLKAFDQDKTTPAEPPWITQGKFWDIARVGCAPDSPARNLAAVDDFKGPPPIPVGFPLGSFEGYVANWTTTKDPCQQPDLRESHGTFVEPISLKTTNKLVPIFGGSKLPMNNDILIPPAMYWSKDPLYSGGENHGGPWESKKDVVIWRGGANGGRNRVNNWTRFHRHRFVSMLNGTAVQGAETNTTGPGQGPNFSLQSYRTYHLTATRYTDLGSWLAHNTDVAMVNLICFPGTQDNKCPYTDPYYEVKPSMQMAEQYRYKYLPDIDGNSFSGRYRSFLLSTSLPIKATIYSEWHDSRLTPWLHFVPMENSFIDVYGILDYFIGTGVNFKTKNGTVVVEGAHDEEARTIALEGKQWAEKVLRKEDMLIYVMRLLMEFARVSDDNREKVGFVEDLSE